MILYSHPLSATSLVADLDTRLIKYTLFRRAIMSFVLLQGMYSTVL
jgi:hypothetical protein